MVKFIRQSAKWAKKRFSEFPDRQLLIADCFSGKIIENADWRIGKKTGKVAPVPQKDKMSICGKRDYAWPEDKERPAGRRHDEVII